MNRFGRVISSKVFFSFPIASISKSSTEEETTICLAQFECILRCYTFWFFFSFFYCVAKRNKTKPEQRIISERETKKKTGERWGREYEKFHFMNVVYRICADSAFWLCTYINATDCFGKKINKTFLLHSQTSFRNVGWARARLLVFDLFMFIY